jgi:hypothetical protein
MVSFLGVSEQGPFGLQVLHKAGARARLQGNNRSSRAGLAAGSGLLTVRALIWSHLCRPARWIAILLADDRRSSRLW